MPFTHFHSSELLMICRSGKGNLQGRSSRDRLGSSLRHIQQQNRFTLHGTGPSVLPMWGSLWGSAQSSFYSMKSKDIGGETGMLRLDRASY